MNCSEIKQDICRCKETAFNSLDLRTTNRSASDVASCRGDQ